MHSAFAPLAMLAMTVIGVACSSFEADRPTNSLDAGAGSSSSGSMSSGGGSTSSSGTSSKPDGGAFACPKSGFDFCDDFSRDDPSDVRGEWTDLLQKESDPEPTIEDGAFHLFAAPETNDDKTERTYLLRMLPSCSGASVIVDLDFRLGSVARNSNLAVISAVGGDGEDHYATLAIRDGNVSLETLNGNRDDPNYALHGSAVAPASGEWAHAELVFDLHSSQTRVAATVRDDVLGTNEVGEDITNIQICRLAIGNDFIAPGEASDRWYDNVTVRVVR